jgi:hypothetical protein
MPRLYLYKLTDDSGGAPCVHDGKLSLAICKPAIRRTAKPGDYILGFAGNSLYKENKNCLIYAAEVGRCLLGSDYYKNKYAGRPDCIYEYFDSRYQRRPGAKFHSKIGDLEHDLGYPPDYGSARVLLVEDCSKFRYFRDSCPFDYLSKYTELAEFIRKMTQGHRTNLSESLLVNVRSLLIQVWETPVTPNNSLVPSAPSMINCSQDEGEVECDC